MGRCMKWRPFMGAGTVAATAVLIFAALLSQAALAEVDVRTPWADVYVGPDGVYVHGPWGRVEVPLSDRERVCSQWRESVREYYKSHVILRRRPPCGIERLG